MQPEQAKARQYEKESDFFASRYLDPEEVRMMGGGFDTGAPISSSIPDFRRVDVSPEERELLGMVNMPIEMYSRMTDEQRRKIIEALGIFPGHPKDSDAAKNFFSEWRNEEIGKTREAMRRLPRTPWDSSADDGRPGFPR